VEKNALQFGYRPPITLLEWMMGFPENYTDLGPRPLETLSSPQLSSGLVGSSSNTINALGVTITRNSLSISTELSYEEWESVGAELFKVEAAWQWWVGDWINYGEKKYGQTYEQALTLTDKSYSTLKHAAAVSAAFEMGRRRPISWSHHEAVQGLGCEHQDAILDQAEREGKPRSWVREKVKEIKGETTIATTDSRLDVIRRLVDELQPHELVVVRDWIDTKLDGSWE
jgi:hypothetical protein